MPAQRAGPAGPSCPGPTEGVGPRHTRGDDQRTSWRGRGPSRPRALGRRPAHRPQALRDRRPGRAHTRFTMLVDLARKDGYGVIARTKNGPALAGYGAITMKDALSSTMTALPAQLRRSLTWDRGKELSAHAASKYGWDWAWNSSITDDARGWSQTVLNEIGEAENLSSNPVSIMGCAGGGRGSEWGWAGGPCATGYLGERARVAQLADAARLKRAVLTGMWVRVPPRARIRSSDRPKSLPASVHF